MDKPFTIKRKATLNEVSTMIDQLLKNKFVVKVFGDDFDAYFEACENITYNQKKYINYLNSNYLDGNNKQKLVGILTQLGLKTYGNR